MKTERFQRKCKRILTRGKINRRLMRGSGKEEEREKKG